MKYFLTAINGMIAGMEENGKFTEAAICKMTTEYLRLSENEREKSLQIIFDILRDCYAAEFGIMSALLRTSQDKRIIYYIISMLESKEYSLWMRLNDMSQLRTYLFRNNVFEQEYEEYTIIKNMYKIILKDIQLRIEKSYPYIPFEARRKKIIIVMKQLLGMGHAPTKRLRVIYNCLMGLGYDVECFICYLPGTGGSWDWGSSRWVPNFADRTGLYEYVLDGVKIKGFNLFLRSADYIEGLRQTVQMIWNEKPEYVLEISEQTILAGLCREFTTLVTMGCTKKIAVTNAPIIATAVGHSQEEQKIWKQILDDSQIVVEVKHVVNELGCKETDNIYKQKDFGIPEDAFVIIVAGNRLDVEINAAFLDVVYQILSLDVHFVVAVIGECPKVKECVENGEWSSRIFFLGNVTKYRETIAIGDVFLNPPRQGGGTGGLFAMMEEVPVITLDNCDVEANTGKAFVCGSIDEMPELVYKYYADKEFMTKQKENCRKEAIEKTDVDNEKNFQMLCDAVKEYTIKQEKSVGLK